METDIYAIGRVISITCKTRIAITELEELTSCCLSNASKDRPGMSELLQVLQAAFGEYDHRMFDVVGPLVGCIMHTGSSLRWP